MVHLIVVCGRREETVAGVFSACVLGIFYMHIFSYQGYDLWKNRKANCRPVLLGYFLGNFWRISLLLIKKRPGLRRSFAILYWVPCYVTDLAG